MRRPKILGTKQDKINKKGHSNDAPGIIIVLIIVIRFIQRKPLLRRLLSKEEPDYPTFQFVW